MTFSIIEKATGEVIDIVDSREEAEFEMANFEAVDATRDGEDYVAGAYEIVENK